MNPSKIRDPRCWKKWEDSGAVSTIAQTSSNMLVEKTAPWHELVHDVIDEAVGNWTRRHFKTPDPQVKAVLLKYAGAVASKILAGATPFPDFSPGWKGKVSDVTFGLLNYDEFKKEQILILVAALRDKFGDRTADFEKGLWGYSLAKIANTVGVVTYMEKVGLDPNILLMTLEEANASMLKMAQWISEKHPEKVLVVDPATDDMQDVVDEIVLRANPPDVSQYLR